MAKKGNRNESVVHLIQGKIEKFSQQHFDEMHAGFAIELFRRVERNRTLDLGRGRPEIWGAGIVYSIARLNFLFDPDRPDPLTPRLICRFFGVKQGTVSQKATRIEKVLDVYLGEEGLSDPKITDMVTFVELPNGLIMPKSMLFKDDAADEALALIEEQRQERQRVEEEERKARQAQIAAEKRRKWREVQPSLFADF